MFTIDQSLELAGPRGISGYASKGFEPVGEAFVENFSRGKELGGACCVYHRGEKVVDLWGGIRNKASGEPWEEDTMVLVFSATKGFAAMTMALLHSRGLLDYEERICTYWPEFAQNGKENMTVRQLLAHQAGLFAFDERVDRSVIADLDRLATIMARQKPEWEPGTRQAYHAVTLGFYVRVPEEIPNSRLATIELANPIAMLVGMPFRMALTSLNPRSPLFRALVKRNPGGIAAIDRERIVARNLEIPSGGGVGTARGIARVYSAFAAGGRDLGLRAETLQLLMAPAIPAVHGFYDEGLKIEAKFSLGFSKPVPWLPFGRPGAFAAPGAGGSFGFADPEREIAYAYVTNHQGPKVIVDARDIALRDALSSVVP